MQNVGKIAVPVGGISPPNLRERLIDKGQVGIPIENRHGLIQGKTVELEECNIPRIRGTICIEVIRVEDDFVHRENLGSLIRIGELVGPCTDGRVGLVVTATDAMRCRQDNVGRNEGAAAKVSHAADDALQRHHVGVAAWVGIVTVNDATIDRMRCIADQDEDCQHHNKEGTGNKGHGGCVDGSETVGKSEHNTIGGSNCGEKGTRWSCYEFFIVSLVICMDD